MKLLSMSSNKRLLNTFFYALWPLPILTSLKLSFLDVTVVNLGFVLIPLAKICIFLSLLKNYLTSKHFCLYWKPSSTAVCLSLGTSPIPQERGNLSRIYSFPMFSYFISCSVWCKTDFKVHNRTEVNMKDSRILAFGFASGLYYYNK